VISNLPLYILSILIGTVVTAGALFVLKRPIAATEEKEEEQKTVAAAA
jgi:PTS system fructose-specific IIC component